MRLLQSAQTLNLNSLVKLILHYPSTSIELKFHTKSTTLTSIHVCLASVNTLLSFQTVNSLFAIIHLLFINLYYSSSKELLNRHFHE